MSRIVLRVCVRIISLSFFFLISSNETPLITKSSGICISHDGEVGDQLLLKKVKTGLNTYSNEQ